jgi:O-antigen ligase
MTAAVARRARGLAVPAATGAVAVAFGTAVGVALAVDIRLGAALAAAVLALPIALVDPPLVIALWAGLTVLSRYPDVGLVMTSTGLLAFGVWLAQWRADPARIRATLHPHRRLLTLLGLLLAWVTISLAWARDPARAGSELVSWYVNAVAIVILLTSVRTPRDVKLVIGAIVVAVAASVAMGLAGVDFGGASSATATATATTSQGRLQGASGDPNFMAAFIVPAIVLGTVLWAAAASRWRAVLPAMIVLLLVGLPATESRGGMLAFLVVLLAGFVVMRGRRSVVLGAATVALLIGGTWISTHPAALARIKSAEQDRGNGRQDLWLVARRMSADHPLIGVGLANFRVRSPDYVRQPGALNYVDLVVDRPHEVHNTYLQLLAENGAIGLGLFLALCWTALASALGAARRFVRAGRHRLAVLSRGVLVADVGLLTASFFITAQSTAAVWLILALGPVLLGVASATDRRRTAIGHSSESLPRGGTVASGG